MPNLQRRARKLLPAVAQLILALLTLPPLGLSFLALVAFIPVVQVLLDPKRLWEAVLNGRASRHGTDHPHSSDPTSFLGFVTLIPVVTIPPALERPYLLSFTL